MGTKTLFMTTLALAAIGLQRFTHAQSCGAGSHSNTITVTNSFGPHRPPWTNISVAVPQFNPVAGQTLVRADITARGGVSGLVEVENTSTAGGCVFQWCLGSSLEVDVPVPSAPPFMLTRQTCGADNLSVFDGSIDFRGSSGATHMISPSFTDATTAITDPAVLAAVFTGSGSVSFNTTAADTTTHMGCSNLSAVFVNNTEVDISIVYTYCSPGMEMCVPGQHGVMSCPCGNPQTPAGSVKGCNNSSATGGAKLSSGGAALLSADTVVFTTSGEKPTATSIVLQGDTLISGGTTFGQGVRCAGGTLVRLYTKTAAAGSIVAPGMGDPTVSARSAALGDTIVAGQTRWYLVYYRDPTVHGGCPSSSTFNATQGQSIAWQP
jgi:hypothetical protein